MCENLKIVAVILQGMQEQQSKQKEEMKESTSQSLDKVNKMMASAMRGPSGVDTKRMVLPYLKNMNFLDKLTYEIASNTVNFKIWRKKLEHWLSTQVSSVGMDDKVVKFFKQLYEAPEGIKT